MLINYVIAQPSIGEQEKFGERPQTSVELIGRAQI